MPDRTLTTAQIKTLAEVRDNIAGTAEAAGPASLGRPVADALRAEYPDLSDATLAHLLGNLTAYAHSFSKENPDALAIELGVVFAAAAIELAALEIAEGSGTNG